MALTSTDLFSENTRDPQPRMVVERSAPKTFEAGTAVMPTLGPVAFNTSTLVWVPWLQSGSNGENVISGWLTEAHTLLAGGETIAQVMLAGTIHYDDAWAAAQVVDGVVSEANFKAAIQATQRTLGIHIQGLAEVR